MSDGNDDPFWFGQPGLAAGSDSDYPFCNDDSFGYGAAAASATGLVQEFDGLDYSWTGFTDNWFNGSGNTITNEAASLDVACSSSETPLYSLTDDSTKISLVKNDNHSTPNSSISYASEDEDSRQEKKARVGSDATDENLCQARKARKKERAQKEPRVAFLTRSENDHLEDGYRWRKYGQKAVKNSPYPRSYYRCTSQKCTVKKHVERSFQDPTIIITTYEGKHHHPCPPVARGNGGGVLSHSMASAASTSTGTSFFQERATHHDVHHESERGRAPHPYSLAAPLQQLRFPDPSAWQNFFVPSSSPAN